MFLEIKNKVEQELRKYLKEIDKLYSLSAISPLIAKNVKDFALRQGKRIRPIIFVIGYLGFAKKIAPGLYRSAISLELLHDFMLVHDDIIDKSDTRRGKPSMHAMLQKYLVRHEKIKFNSKDLAIAVGDVMYALSIHSFLSVQEDMQRKELALKKLIEAAIYTGGGEFLELLSGIQSIDEISRQDIYKIYDYKTATYTFASPLASGAMLAGAKKKETKKLFKYGMYVGRAFQIKDDILGMFGKESEIGKSNLTDIREAKKTILIWYAYNNSDKRNKNRIKNILSKRNANKSDLLEMRRLITESGALDYAKGQIRECLNKASAINNSSKMYPQYKKLLEFYSQDLLKL
jgi:geranylgeranyl diphosphate synthase type I